MNFKNLKLLFLTISFFITSTANAGPIDNDEATAFAVFLQDLVRTTQSSKPGSFCLVGSDEISAIIDQEKNIIDLDANPGKYNSCKAIYIAMNKQKGLAAEITKFNKHKILTLAIFDGFVESGGMVQVQIGRRNFELTLNSKAIKEAGIKLNSLAMSLVIN